LKGGKNKMILKMSCITCGKEVKVSSEDLQGTTYVQCVECGDNSTELHISWKNKWTGKTYTK
jgi:DNA-directed RNA polymerase subunit RPC12/RpoP